DCPQTVPESLTRRAAAACRSAPSWRHLQRERPTPVLCGLRSQFVRHPTEFFKLADREPVGNESPSKPNTFSNRRGFVTQVESSSRIQKSEVHPRALLAAFKDVY